MTQFDLGTAAFDAGDDHLLFNCTDDFKAGYKEAYMEWAASEYKRAANNPDSSHLEEYWDTHYSEATNGMAQRLLTAINDTKPSRKAIASNVILGMTAAFISGALFMAAIFLSNEEVAAYTAAVLGGVK